MKVLLIRRDNIGDLICTTPAIRALREKYPDAKIGVLVNTYNADAVANNPDIDEVYAYEKAKHVPDKSKISVWWSNFKILRRIQKERYDIAIGCGAYSPRLARYAFSTGAPMRIGYIKKDSTKSKYYTISLAEPEEQLHEVEMVFTLLSPLGITGTPPPLKARPATEEVLRVQDFLTASGLDRKIPLIAFHISSRRPENRWPVEKFTGLGNLLLKEKKAAILLLWSPGSERNPYHPGDDEKAEAITRSLQPAVIPYRTTQLKELIAALGIADIVVCSDGGAMHIAAALGKPIVAIWGSTKPEKWRPWGVEHILLQDETQKAENIGVEAAYRAVEKLLP